LLHVFPFHNPPQTKLPVACGIQRLPKTQCFVIICVAPAFCYYLCGTNVLLSSVWHQRFVIICVAPTFCYHLCGTNVLLYAYI
jgi:hypothetical protein